MALDYDHLMATSVVDLPLSYRDTETMLYALSIGIGRDPLNRRELPYVSECEGPPSTMPSMATVLVPDMFPPDLGWDFNQVLHAEQRMQLHRPLPPAADLLINKHISAVYDRGPKLGAVVMFEAEGRLAKDDTVIFTIGNTVIARGDGGFGGANGRGPKPHRAPRREPDLSCDITTRLDQALLYRLTGDRNPLHADPVLAKSVGFDVPILHGLCTYGIACHAILKTICNYDSTLITGMDSRFSAPVFPGETLATEIWQGDGGAHFQTKVKERDRVVLSNGFAGIAA